MRALFKLAMALAACLILAGCQTQLYTNLSENEANLIVAALRGANISAEKRPGEEGTFIVMVEDEHFAEAVRILESESLPGRRYGDLGKVFGGESMFSTPMEEKARFLYAMQEELAQTISGIDGVLSARVHLVLPEKDQLGRDVQTPSGAVMVRHIDDERHDPVRYRADIRRLVAAGVPNLDEERIVVSFFPVAKQVRAHAAPVMKSVLGLQVGEHSERRVLWYAGIGAAIVACLIGLNVWALLLRKSKKDG